MHVVQLVPSLAIGGLEVMVGHLAGWLRSRQVTTEVVYFELPDQLGAELTRQGVLVSRLRLPPYIWRLYPRSLIRHLVGRSDVVLHGHMYAWHKATAVARWRRAACVYTQHGLGDDWISKEWNEMRRSACFTQAAVGVSPDTHRFLIEQLGMPAERTYEVPNGIPDIHQTDAPPANWGVPIPQGAPVIGMVGRLAAPKDQETLVESMILVQRIFHNAQLVLIGEGPKQAQLQQLIAERNAHPFVHLLGARRDVAELLHSLDVFVLSSSSEGHSMAILEAMSAERAIVATRVGGNVQLLDDGSCGLLVPAGDPAVMADAIMRLLRDSEEATRLASLARRRFLEHFSLDRMGEAYCAIYRAALARQDEG
jgi:glycosyltransferase involved in cell wall biosynthesis